MSKEKLKLFIESVIKEELQKLHEDNDALTSRKQVKRFNKMRDQWDMRKKATELRRIYRTNAEILEKTEQQFTRIVKRFIPRGAKYEFLHQLKPTLSVLEKILRRGYSISSIGDLVRGAVLFYDGEDVNRFIDNLLDKGDRYIKEYEFKEAGSDPDFGYYGTHHIDMHINDMDVELQVMPEALWDYKESAHEIYTKWRDKPHQVPEIDKEISRRLFQIGNIKGYGLGDIKLSR